MDLYSLISQKPISPHKVYKQISPKQIASSLSNLIDEKYEELKINDVLFNNFSSLASTSILEFQNKEQNSTENQAKLQSFLFSNDFIDKFNELVNVRQQTPNPSS